MTDFSYLCEIHPNRFQVAAGQKTMKAVVTTGNGGYDKLSYTDVPKPVPKPGEVLLRVLAAGVNNTEINTRLGWYSSSITGSTDETAGGDTSGQTITDGGWNEKTPFPFIQGTDCCGEVVALGDGVASALMGKRVLVRACMRLNGFDSLENIWMASDFDGAFAEFVRVPAGEVFSVNTDWTDVELATIPCAYGTAENMIHRTGVRAGDRVLVTGASGGVGSAAVQLAKRRGATVIAVASESKFSVLSPLGAEQLIDRNADLVQTLGESSVDVVIDNVAGDNMGSTLKLLKRGGRYTSSGAIAGPMVNMDMRDFYLKDLNLIGCTAWDEPVFPNLVRYIERGEIVPLVAATYPLRDIVAAQKAFMKKTHVGNFVLVPGGSTA